MDLQSLKEKEFTLRKNLYNTYLDSKKLFIRAEELLEQMNFFAAPLVEHRDALDHVMRYFSIKDNAGLSEEALVELDKALGHELRAYFDIADFVCVTIREEISASLKHVSSKKIKKIWTDYLSIKNRVVSVSEEIAAIRESRSGSLKHIEKYKKVLDEIFDIYKLYKTQIEPEIKKGGIW